jgi:hypothetical protein
VFVLEIRSVVIVRERGREFARVVGKNAQGGKSSGGGPRGCFSQSSSFGGPDGVRPKGEPSQRLAVLTNANTLVFTATRDLICSWPFLAIDSGTRQCAWQVLPNSISRLILTLTF